ncbi:hypothetical protein CFIMG_001242RA [Ceratocystis fimbriata CBS 114723]|uniref:N-acetyltransferase ESCO zinc-finger domain-containing protein n=1 Tax=Ceratocystis fimbriata CBS 114723 TaxID=1035309 RepID=A0A2C5X1F5_9PEZI|nr:hypothetical protein CFIMG_001242RA [Ceratocystis fimbriata CBS 114723]
MATNTPELTTFPNLLSRQKERARPARTYGKRTASDVSSHHACSKKQRSSPPPASVLDPDELPPLPKCNSTAPSASGTPVSESIKGPTKASILGYFKPVQRHSSPGFNGNVAPSTTPKNPISEPNEGLYTVDDDNDIASSPPAYSSLPKPKAPGRSYRRLRLKPIAFDATRKTTSSPASSPSIERKGSEATKAKTNSAPSSVVQTTLNLTNKPAFNECSVCGVVYNPLHPPDVKFHSKVHAAATRSRNRVQKLELKSESVSDED